MRARILSCVCCGAFSACVSSPSNELANCGELQSRVAEMAPPPRPLIFRFPTYGIKGSVVKCDASSLVVLPPDGKKREFRVGVGLSAGGVPGTAPYYAYRMSDLKDGDLVEVLYNSRAGGDVAECLCIRRRPNGRVPPAPGDKATLLPFHERMNAQQDFEEKGIPIPEKFRRMPGAINGVPVLPPGVVPEPPIPGRP